LSLLFLTFIDDGGFISATLICSVDLTRHQATTLKDIKQCRESKEIGFEKLTPELVVEDSLSWTKK
jgi:hypothetical protein